MANEAQVRISLSIRKTENQIVVLDYKSPSGSFQVDVDGTKGPAIGAITITTEGTDIDFGELATPSLCILGNQDSENYYEYGMYDPIAGVFDPMGEVGPGEAYLVKLSRNLLSSFDEVGTGTGTGGQGPKTFRLKAHGADLVALVQAFEK